MLKLTRTNELFDFYTEIFATREEAKANVNEVREEFVIRTFKNVHGADGFAVAVSTNELKELHRVAKNEEAKQIESDDADDVVVKPARTIIKRIVVSFTRNLTLPRFTMKIGDTWEVRVDRLQKDGFTLGGGFINSDDYEVLGWK